MFGFCLKSKRFDFKQIPEWTEMMGDPVLTTAMMDRILHHARCFSLKGESYRLKHPELFASVERPDGC